MVTATDAPGPASISQAMRSPPVRPPAVLIRIASSGSGPDLRHADLGRAFLVEPLDAGAAARFAHGKARPCVDALRRKLGHLVRASSASQQSFAGPILLPAQFFCRHRRSRGGRLSRTSLVASGRGAFYRGAGLPVTAGAKRAALRGARRKRQHSTSTSEKHARWATHILEGAMADQLAEDIISKIEAARRSEIGGNRPRYGTHLARHPFAGIDRDHLRSRGGLRHRDRDEHRRSLEQSEDRPRHGRGRSRPDREKSLTDAAAHRRHRHRRALRARQRCGVDLERHARRPLRRSARSQAASCCRTSKSGSAPRSRRCPTMASSASGRSRWTASACSR